MAGNSDIQQIVNSDTIQFSDGDVGRELKVTEDYEANDGLIGFNGVLNDDSFIVDRLIVGGNTSGRFRVSVNNLGGSGAKTLNSIELITVGGNSAGEFTQ